MGRAVIKVKIKKFNENALIPNFQTKGSSGADLHAAILHPIEIKPMQRALIPTGIGLEIPEGYEIQVRARSGLAMKKGLSLVNGIGTIDADYRGELGVLLINLGSDPFQVKRGDRIAQLVITPVSQAVLELSDDLDVTPRSGGGFGHTG